MSSSASTGFVVDSTLPFTVYRLIVPSSTVTFSSALFAASMTVASSISPSAQPLATLM